MQKNQKRNAVETAKPPANMLTALIASIAVTAVTFIIYSALVTYTNITEESAPTAVLISNLLSVLIGGVIASMNAEKKGWLYGMSAGALYAAFMIAVGFSVLPEINVGIKTLSTLLLSAAGGGIGGIIGINLGIVNNYSKQH